MTEDEKATTKSQSQTDINNEAKLDAERRKELLGLQRAAIGQAYTAQVSIAFSSMQKHGDAKLFMEHCDRAGETWLKAVKAIEGRK